jgi:excisionase family DNA binding protein
MQNPKSELPAVSTSYRGVAAMLSVSARKAAELVRSGELPSFRVGRRRLVRLVDVERFAARRVEAKTQP